jgi:hypothetical protein
MLMPRLPSNIALSKGPHSHYCTSTSIGVLVGILRTAQGTATLAATRTRLVLRCETASKLLVYTSIRDRESDRAIKSCLRPPRCRLA